MISIITPSCRQENLQKLHDSIEFDKIDKWIIVYDTSKNRTYKKLFTNNSKILEVEHDEIGKAGHAQRNYGTRLVKDGHIYFLDDDNIIHPDFWAVVSILEDKKFYTFDQQRTSKTILKGNIIRTSYIDTAMFIVHKKHTDGVLWKKERYDADGLFISRIYAKYRNSHIYIEQVCCYYNYLITSQLPRSVVSFQDLTRNSFHSRINRDKPNIYVKPPLNLIGNPRDLPIKIENTVQNTIQKTIESSPGTPVIINQIQKHRLSRFGYLPKQLKSSNSQVPLCPFSRGYRHLDRSFN